MNISGLKIRNSLSSERRTDYLFILDFLLSNLLSLGSFVSMDFSSSAFLVEKKSSPKDKLSTFKLYYYRYNPINERTCSSTDGIMFFVKYSKSASSSGIRKYIFSRFFFSMS